MKFALERLKGRYISRFVLSNQNVFSTSYLFGFEAYNAFLKNCMTIEMWSISIVNICMGI